MADEVRFQLADGGKDLESVTSERGAHGSAELLALQRAALGGILFAGR
jgi:hypothetical protein